MELTCKGDGRAMKAQAAEANKNTSEAIGQEGAHSQASRKQRGNVPKPAAACQFDQGRGEAAIVAANDDDDDPR